MEGRKRLLRRIRVDCNSLVARLSFGSLFLRQGFLVRCRARVCQRVSGRPTLATRQAVPGHSKQGACTPADPGSPPTLGQQPTGAAGALTRTSSPSAAPARSAACPSGSVRSPPCRRQSLIAVRAKVRVRVRPIPHRGCLSGPACREPRIEQDDVERCLALTVFHPLLATLAQAVCTHM